MPARLAKVRLESVPADLPELYCWATDSETAFVGGSGAHCPFNRGDS